MVRLALVCTTLLAAACSDSDQAPDVEDPDPIATEEETAPAPTQEETGDGSGPEAEESDGTGEFETFEELERYLAEAAEIPVADADSAVPPYELDGPAGAPGFTRYVFREVNGEIIPSLVEGPIGDQIRCQDPALPCSYADLVALAEAGGPIPDALGLTTSELDDLVAELNAAREVIDYYADVDTACADGFVSDRTQTANMGSHFYHLGRILDGAGFDPAEPEILLYAVAGSADPGGQLGYCDNGVWIGAEMEITGLSYYLPREDAGDTHPVGFTGDFDNWHLHYNLCRGAGTDAILTAQDCAAVGGSYSNAAAWMIHAWANPDRDNELGVFSMWNPSIWPVSDPETVTDARVGSIVSGQGLEVFPISDFRFATIEAGVGEKILFANADSVPHTVTAGTSGSAGDSFDSGVLAPSQSFSLTFDEAGEYAYFCALHPDMQGTIVVG